MQVTLGEPEPVLTMLLRFLYHDMQGMPACFKTDLQGFEAEFYDACFKYEVLIALAFAELAFK